MIKWMDDYSVHNKTIDDQHKALFDIAKKAYLIAERHASISDIKLVLNELFEYVKTHFKDEEDHMEKIGYPDLAHHKKIHQEITLSLIALVKNIKTINDFKEKLNIITEKWLLEHILKEDMKYYKYQKQKIKEQQEATFEEDTSFEEVVPEFVIYICGCKGEKHKIPHHIHTKICKGSKYSCKVCKSVIRTA
ncbi:bacteriohemerythrin [Campylobacter peloridis]|uniref:Bacteriohemerythrin n=1 Tax=Campylobacter peloridis TaxID=488546 RepID=A0A5C7E084_9BACT|nr:hemerythrin family protein [Campylobacter peloridis]TXE84501.1 bacteriohemerythrin [Campylobacter peloridis]